MRKLRRNKRLQLTSSGEIAAVCGFTHKAEVRAHKPEVETSYGL
jgi:hypothetical protein